VKDGPAAGWGGVWYVARREQTLGRRPGAEPVLGARRERLGRPQWTMLYSPDGLRAIRQPGPRWAGVGSAKACCVAGLGRRDGPGAGTVTAGAGSTSRTFRRLATAPHAGVRDRRPARRRERLARVGAGARRVVSARTGVVSTSPASSGRLTQRAAPDRAEAPRPARRRDDQPRAFSGVPRIDNFFKAASGTAPARALAGELRWSYRYAWTLSGRARNPARRLSGAIPRR